MTNKTQADRIERSFKAMAGASANAAQAFYEFRDAIACYAERLSARDERNRKEALK